MKKQLFVVGIFALLVSGAAFTAIAQQKGNKDNKKEQPQGKGKGNNNNKQGGKGNANTGNKGGNVDKQRNKGNGNNGNNNGNDNSANDNAKGNNGKNGGINVNANNGEGFSWTPDNFKDRKKLKNQEKVSVCHKVNNRNEPGVTINVASNALKAHMNHGDVMGSCAAVNNSIFSNTFLTRRTDYYNTLQNTYEQVSYSRSILDYALQRLTNSRLQLVALQNNNVPQVEIDRKQAVILELEQNVSLLETLVGVAANLVVNKLQQ